MRLPLALLTLTALATPAAAAGSASPGAVMDTRRLVLELLLLSDGRVDPLLVGVRGAPSTRLEQRVAQVRADASLHFEALPGDGALVDQVALAMGRNGARCALSLEPAGDDAWSLRLWGSCAHPPGVLVDGPATTGARVGRHVMDDPRDPELLVEAMSLQLREDASAGDELSWQVIEGSGYPLSTLRFALQVGDLPTVLQLERERRWGTSSTVILAATGGAAALTGLAVMGRGFTLASNALSYEERVADEQRAWTGAVISAAGVLVLSGVPRLRRSFEQRRSQPDDLYTRDQAQALIDAYNSDMRSELGLGRAARAGEPSAELLDEVAP